MKAKVRWLVLLITAVLMLATVCLAACSPDEPPAEEVDNLRIEAEATNVVLEPYDAKGAATTANKDSANKTSNRYVSGLVKDSTITWFVESNQAATTNLRLAIANGKAGAAAMSAGSVISLTLNNEAVTLPSFTITAASQYLDDWNILLIPSANLKQGLNTLVMKIIAEQNTINVDYLDIEKVEGTAISAHSHLWNNATSYVPATCGVAGEDYQICTKSACGYTYKVSNLAALDHIYENWDYVTVDGKTYVGEVCNRNCGAYKGGLEGLVDVTGIQNLGVVVNSFETIYAKTAVNQRTQETVFSASEAFAGLPGGLDNPNAGGYKEAPGNGSDIGHIANVSNPGNYVQFDIFASEKTVADIALRMANTRNNGTAILDLDPFGDYIDFKLYNGSVESAKSGTAGDGYFKAEVKDELISLEAPLTTDGHTKHHFYNETVDDYEAVRQANEENGISFNFDYVKFPGTAYGNWYEWKFVLVQGVQLEEGLNTILFRPNPKDGNRSIPNTAGIYIYTEKDVITPDAGINTATINGSTYTPNGLTVKNDFHQVLDQDQLPTGQFKFGVGEAKANSELVIDFTTTVAIENLSEYLSLSFNGERVRLRLNVGAAGSYRIAIPLSSLPLGANILNADVRQEGLSVTGVAFYTVDALASAHSAFVEESKTLGEESLWDAGFNTALQPKLTFGVADEGVRSKTDGTLDAGGEGVLEGGCISNYSGTNSLTWTFHTSAAGTVDFAIRTACANWQASSNGNVNMINLDKFFSITIDGIAVDLADLDLKCTGGADWHNWSNIVIENVVLAAGDHTIVMKGKGGAFPNTNLLWAYSDDAITFTKAGA